MATSFTSAQRGATTQIVDLVTSNAPTAGTPEVYTIQADGSMFGFEALQNGSVTLRFQTPATDANTDWLPLFEVARAINKYQAEPNTVVTVTITDGVNTGLFAGDGFLVEARGNSTATLTVDSGIRLPDWAATINANIEASGPGYVLSALPVIGQDIVVPELTFTVTPYVADTIATQVTAVVDPAAVESLDTIVQLSRQAFDLMDGDNRSATGMVAAQIENTGVSAVDVDLGAVLSQDTGYTIPTDITVTVTGEFSVDNATSFSGTVFTGSVALSLNGGDVTPVFVPQPDQITAFGNEDNIRLQFREQKPLLQLDPGTVVVVVATSRS